MLAKNLASLLKLSGRVRNGPAFYILVEKEKGGITEFCYLYGIIG